MQVYLSLTRRELGAFFLSWVAYVVIAGAALLTGLSFVKLLGALQGEATLMPITEVFLDSLFLWWILLFSAPVITMRLFALEKYTGTFETLMTAPVSDLQVVLAKFSAALILFMIMWLPMVGCILILRYFTKDPALLDPGTLAGMSVGILFLGILYMSIGCFASSLTSNQVVAAMTSFGIGLGLFIVGYESEQAPPGESWMGDAINYVSMTHHMQDFARGAVDSRCIVYYLSLSALFLFLTYRVVESRRWK
jgi:ABC-2 type transport system permease protein